MSVSVRVCMFVCVWVCMCVCVCVGVCVCFKCRYLLHLSYAIEFHFL